MKNTFWINIVKYIVIVVILLGSSFSAAGKAWEYYSLKKWTSQYVQPPLPYGRFPWTVRSIDTQVISKHWPDVTREKVIEQISLIKKLGVNYVAIGTPYDRNEDLQLWANEAHAAGLSVWFRAHWATWEGDEGYPATMTPNEYLEKTRQFILDNPTIFAPGDAFTVAVEAEQVGVGLGKRFLTWDEYRNFLLSEIAVASDAFSEIGLGGKVYTNWLSMNGWVVENQLTRSVVDRMGLIVVDHFVGQSQTIGEFEDVDLIVNQTVSDLDRFYEKWKVPILLGEWGYQIYQNVPEERQEEVIRKLFEKLKTRQYLVGVNYWVHMGNSAAVIKDEYGSKLAYRRAASVIKSFFDPFSPPLKLDGVIP